LLATALGLEASAGFARYEHLHCGVQGQSDIPTDALVRRITEWAAPLGHHTVASRIPPDHRTRRWAICSGSGAQAETLREAYDARLDTLIVGEGPHWSAVEAEEHGLVIVYAGHYATETLGVRALAEQVSATFGLPWTFVHAPTGL
jgi:putative NIF3 family GTP cyclohydrolase 1 type 2